MTATARHQQWDAMPMEALNPLLGRRMISGENITIAQLELRQGCVVPKHSHPSEQVSQVFSGALRFLLGETQDEEVVVRAGGVLLIPPHLPHSVQALEDTLCIDVFSPRRQDWLDGSDAYLRRG